MPATSALPESRKESGMAVLQRGHLFGDTLLVGGLTVAAKLMGALKTVVLAGVPGPGLVLDSYLLAFLIPSFLSEVFFAAFVPALVPRLAELRHEGDLDSRNSLYGGLFARALQYSTAAAAILALIALTVRGIAPGQKMRMSAGALLWMTPLLSFSACSNVWRAVLVAERRFATIAISPCLSAATIMACAVVPIAVPMSSRLAIGTLLGAILEAAALAAAVSRAGCPIVPSTPARKSPEPMYAQYRFLVAGNLATSGALFIDQCMAALWGSGGLSIYTFGTRFPNMLLAAGPSALSTTVLPHLADSAVRGKQSMRSLLRRVLFWSGAAGAVTSMAFIACSSLIIRSTMQHGVFTAADTAIVARVQSWSIAQLPFAMCIAALTRALASSGENRVLAPMAGLTIIFTPVLDYLFLRWMGVAGVALSHTIVLAVTAAALGMIVFQYASVPRAVEAAA